MEKIEFKNNEEPYLSAENLNQMQDNIEEAIDGVVLYENASGSNGDITLNANRKNYNYIIIHGRRGDQTISTIVPKESSYFQFGGTYSNLGNNQIGFYSKLYNINATTINVNQYSRYIECTINIISSGINFITEDNLYITKIVGY